MQKEKMLIFLVKLLIIIHVLGLVDEKFSVWIKTGLGMHEERLSRSKLK